MTDLPESRHRVAAAELEGEVRRHVRGRKRRRRHARWDSLYVQMLGWEPEEAWKYPKNLNSTGE